MDHQDRNERIIELFSAVLPRREQLLPEVKRICAAAEHNPTNLEPGSSFEPDSNQQIELNHAIAALSGHDDLTDEQVDRIVEAMHEILPPEVRVLRDNGHESWICVQKVVGEEDRIFVYSPSQKFESNRFKEEHQQIIDCRYGRPDWRPLEFTVFQPCLKAKRPQDEFVFVLAYALCRAMGQPVSGFENALDGEDTQYVRNEIVRLIRLPSLPQLGVSVENWELAKNH